MEILSLEDMVEFVVRGRGRGWLQDDVPGRNVNGRGRFQSRGHGREGFPPRRDVGRDVRLELPPEPGPVRHSDWSSTSSPPARMSTESCNCDV